MTDRDDVAELEEALGWLIAEARRPKGKAPKPPVTVRRKADVIRSEIDRLERERDMYEERLMAVVKALDAEFSSRPAYLHVEGLLDRHRTLVEAVEEFLRRGEGPFVCQDCHAQFTILPPQDCGFCINCGGPVSKTEDDTYCHPELNDYIDAVREALPDGSGGGDPNLYPQIDDHPLSDEEIRERMSGKSYGAVPNPDAIKCICEAEGPGAGVICEPDPDCPVHGSGGEGQDWSEFVPPDPDACEHKSTWCDLTGTGTISCKRCGIVLYNRYGPDGDKLRDAPEDPHEEGDGEHSLTTIANAIRSNFNSLVCPGPDSHGEKELDGWISKLEKHAYQPATPDEPPEDAHGDEPGGGVGLLEWLWKNPGHVVALHRPTDEIVVAHADSEGKWAMRTDGASRRVLIEDPWGDDSDLQRYRIVDHPASDEDEGDELYVEAENDAPERAHWCDGELRPGPSLICSRHPGTRTKRGNYVRLDKMDEEARRLRREGEDGNE